MPGREYAATEYKYAFNGKEKDAETSTGAIAFEARIFDARIARFFSIDPRQVEYPWQTPHAYYHNSPIGIVDFKGMSGPYQEADEYNLSEQNAAGTSLNEQLGSAQTSVSQTNDHPQNSIPAAHGENPSQQRTGDATKTHNINGKVYYPDDFTGPLPDGALKISNLFEDAAKEMAAVAQSQSEKYPGAVFVTIPWMDPGSGVTYPPTIFIGPAGNQSSYEITMLKRHEYGHYLQFIALGASYTRYMTVIGIPSLMSAAANPSGHRFFWTETSANLLSFTFFGKPANWNTKDYPLTSNR